MSEEDTNYKLPDSSIWPHISKLSIIDDKPIMLDYWTDHLIKKSVIGVRENGEKLLVKKIQKNTQVLSKKFLK